MPCERNRHLFTHCHCICSERIHDTTAHVTLTTDHHRHSSGAHSFTSRSLTIDSSTIAVLFL
jgi:hypothetical protein